MGETSGKLKWLEFSLRRNFLERPGRFFVMFLLFLIPSQPWRALVSLFLLSSLLPKDIESREERLVLSLPVKRWQIFTGDFISGAVVLLVAGFLISAISGGGVGIEPLRWIGAMAFVYGLSVGFSVMGKGNFGLPLLIVVIDLSLSATPWGLFSPSFVGSPLALVIDAVVFMLAMLAYEKEGKLWS